MEKNKATIYNKLMHFLSKITSLKILAKLRFRNVCFGNGVQITGLQDVEIGQGSCIGDNVWINTNVRGGGVTLKIGNCVLIGRNSVCSSTNKLEIGSYTFTGACVLISNSLHLYDDISKLYIEGVKDCGPMLIEENCWISFGAMIYGDITIGRGSVIGAHCVVTENIPPFSVVVGNPQRIVKMYNPLSCNWESVKIEKDLQHLIKIREKHPLPSRKEYLEILEKNARIKQVDPLCAGRGRWI